MDFGSMLGTFFIGPLKLIFEIIFQTAVELGCSPGLAIVFLSLSMNLLVLPLYRRADRMQMQARDKEAELAEGIAHIKKTFSGSERVLVLQTYYRQNGYSPLSALKGSVSLFLEIPFFIAAYQFLSRLETLKGVSFGPLADLGSPDALITIMGISFNLLPLLMTLINFISSAVYLKGFPLKTKVQLYAVALFFLVFLYSSPSGLLFYWTLNNVFSLVKNIVYRIAGALKKDGASPSAEKRQESAAASDLKGRAPDRRLFLGAAAFLTVLTGLLIPAACISASPQEFVYRELFFHPLWYLLSALCYAAGFFIFWLGVFYWLSGPKGKVVFEYALCCLSGVFAVDYLFFGTKLGLLSSMLRYEGGVYFSTAQCIINTAVVILVALLMFLIVKKRRSFVKMLLLAACTAAVVMSCINVYTIASSVSGISAAPERKGPHFELSRSGSNVVVIFLDRAMAEYMPFLLQERPDLKESFDGFTWYSNTISFGGHTNFAAPALMGGYEYTPVELNKRSSESLMEKHNESLKVMPVLFSNNGFKVTVFDAPYANYMWIPDLSIYDEWPDISTYITKGYFGDTSNKEVMISRNMRNFFLFGMMKSIPAGLQPLLYDAGCYLQAGEASNGVVQTWISKSEAKGISQDYMDGFLVLENLGYMTEISDGDENTFMFLYNDAPHEPMMLQEPEYVPSETVDNRLYDDGNNDRFSADERLIRVNSAEKMAHYQCNMAALLEIGEWLDLLRSEGAYDNTRIIIVSDHGFYLYQTPELTFRVGNHSIDATNYYPLLMVKDFGSTGFTVSDEFMTNADVPALAAEGIIADPVNPFTGKLITTDEKTAHAQFITTSTEWDVNTNNGNTFKASGWAAVSGNIWDRASWTFIDSSIVLDEHRVP